MNSPELITSIQSSFERGEGWLIVTALSALFLGWSITSILQHRGAIEPGLRHELALRLRTWAVIIPVAVIPILIGHAGIALAVFVLGFVCFREFSRATGLSNDLPLIASVLTGLLIVAIAIFRQNYVLLLLSAPVVAGLSAFVALLKDQPDGYLRRVALANLGFMICGLWPGHLGFLGNGESHAAILIWFILSTELNDVFAFVSGKLFGRTALCRHTSPRKTRGGLVGSMILTTTFITLSGSFLFHGQTLGQVPLLIPLGMLVSLAGSSGDLILSSIKRDLHLKDLSNALPGHGGLLDRCDSLIFAAPVVALFFALIDSILATQSLAKFLP